MRKSKFGKETAFLWVPERPLYSEQIVLKTVDSTLEISSEEQEKIDAAFEKAKAENPNFFDGLLWRYEGHHDIRGGTHLIMSPTTYTPHNIRRHENHPVSYDTDQFLSKHVNPFSVNAVQVTADGYILIGVKGDISDQQGLGVMGAGFIKREKGLPPRNIFSEALRESAEETSYASGTEPNEGDIESLSALGTIWGRNHDTTTAIYVPLRATSKEVDLGNLEHSDLLFLPSDRGSLERFLQDGGMNGLPAVDHLLGGVELYMHAKEKGYVK